jgi:glucose-1-phosphate cytidylyltransferase
MKVLILSGGYGTRLSEETYLKPKPMVEVGEMPIIWHIMKSYSNYGFNEFILLLGYKGYCIKEFFANYFMHSSDITIDLAQNNIYVHQSNCEPWTITFLDTGLNAMTGARIKKARQYLGRETFMLTYGDGLCDVNINDLYRFHKSHGKMATVTAVKPGGKFGAMDLSEKNYVTCFREKSRGDEAWINGGYFVLEPEIFQYIKDGDSEVWEKTPLEKLSNDNQLVAFRHDGFWRPMDTLRDKNELDELWKSGKAPWKVWDLCSATV